MSATATTAWETIESALPQLTPIQKLQLIEEVARTLRQSTTSHSASRPDATWDEFFRELDAIPVANPNDGFSGRDHDRILYGEKS